MQWQTDVIVLETSAQQLGSSLGLQPPRNHSTWIAASMYACGLTQVRQHHKRWHSSRRNRPCFVATRNCRDGSTHPPIVCVAKEWATKMLCMNTDLMRSTCHELPLHQCRSAMRKCVKNSAQRRRELKLRPIAPARGRWQVKSCLRCRSHLELNMGPAS
jgi:hypothetical protein